LRIGYQLRGKNYTKRQFYDSIPECAKSIGYLVTVDECDNFPKVQFLKHSPFIKDDGNIGMFLNLGVLFRSLLYAECDYPGRGNIVERIEIHAGGVVKGYKHAGTHVVTEAMRARFTKGEAIVSYKMMSIHDSDTVPTSVLCQRYGGSPCEFEDLARDISKIRVGWLYNSTLLRRIYKSDYGY